MNLTDNITKASEKKQQHKKLGDDHMKACSTLNHTWSARVEAKAGEVKSRDLAAMTRQRTLNL